MSILTCRKYRKFVAVVALKKKFFWQSLPQEILATLPQEESFWQSLPQEVLAALPQEQFFGNRCHKRFWQFCHRKKFFNKGHRNIFFGKFAIGKNVFWQFCHRKKVF